MMKALRGWIAKGGAEGLLCAAGPDGLAVVLKSEDGNGRALRPALAALGTSVGLELPDFAHVALPNMHGEPSATVALM